jgi:hypothetical protein
LRRFKRDETEALVRNLEGERDTGEHAGSDVGRLGALARAISRLPRRQSTGLSEPARARQRRRVLATAQAPAPTTSARVHSGLATANRALGQSIAVVALVAVLGATAAAGVATATTRSMPGDACYALKLAAEELVTTADPRAEAERRHMLASASRRIGEADRAMTRGEPEAATVALQRADRAVGDGAEAHLEAFHTSGATLRPLVDFAAAQRERVDELELAEGGPRLESAVKRLTVRLDRIDQRVAALTGGCGPCIVPTAQAPGVVNAGTIPPAEEPFRACPCGTAGEDGPGADVTETQAAPTGSDEGGRASTAQPTGPDAGGLVPGATPETTSGPAAPQQPTPAQPATEPTPGSTEPPRPQPDGGSTEQPADAEDGPGQPDDGSTEQPADAEDGPGQLEPTPPSPERSEPPAREPEAQERPDGDGDESQTGTGGPELPTQGLDEGASLP